MFSDSLDKYAEVGELDHKQMELCQSKKLLHKKGNHQQNEKTTCEMGKIFSNATNKGLIPSNIQTITIYTVFQRSPTDG